METYLNEIRPIVKKGITLDAEGKSEESFSLFQRSHSIAVKAILRILYNEHKINKQGIALARNFLHTTGYKEDGRALDNPIETLLHTLKMKSADILKS